MEHSLELLYIDKPAQKLPVIRHLTLGLGDLSNTKITRISSVKPVL